MLLNIVITLLIILILSILFKGIRSMKAKSTFVKHARSLGYLVYERPFVWFGSGLFKESREQYRLKGDSNYLSKNELSKYDMVVSNILFSVMIEISSADVAKELYMKINDGFYVKGDFGFAHLKRVISTNNVLLSEGHDWKQRRKILSTVFNYDFIVQKLPKIQQITKTALQNLEQNHFNKEKPQQIKCDIAEPLMEVFSTVILKCFFQGDDLNQIQNQKSVDFINKLLLKVMGIGRSVAGLIMGVKIAKMGLTQTNREINHGVQMFRNAAKTLIEKRIKQIRQAQKSWGENHKPEDIVEALMKSKHISLGDDDQTETSSQGGQPKENIDVDSIISEFLTFFLAGSETTFSFTRMMIYRLADNPKFLEKVKEQFQKVANTPQITLSQLKNLKYFENVQKQVLRMDSSVGGIFFRVATKDHYLGNLQILKNSVVSVRLRALHFKQSTFPSPNTFNPDRWNDESSLNTYSYLPFSAGGRNCIGKHLALLENKIFMVEFLRNYKQISLSKDLKDVKMQMGNLYGPETITTTLIK